MKSKTILVCVLVALLGIGAMIAGFVAEATKLKGSQLVYIGLVPECKYPRSPSMGLAIAAIVALVLACGIITSATGGCCSCCEALPKLSKLARLCIIISWITYFAAITLFLTGAKYPRTGVERLVNGEYRCYALWHGIFFGAGIAGLVSVLFGLAYYLFYVSAQNGAAKTSRVDLELEAPPYQSSPIMATNHRCLHKNIETPMPEPHCFGSYCF